MLHCRVSLSGWTPYIMFIVMRGRTLANAIRVW